VIRSGCHFRFWQIVLQKAVGDHDLAPWTGSARLDFDGRSAGETRVATVS